MGVVVCSNRSNDDCSGHVSCTCVISGSVICAVCTQLIILAIEGAVVVGVAAYRRSMRFLRVRYTCGVNWDWSRLIVHFL